jgi:hypothetical protein
MGGPRWTVTSPGIRLSDDVSDAVAVAMAVAATKAGRHHVAGKWTANITVDDGHVHVVVVHRGEQNRKKVTRLPIGGDGFGAAVRAATRTSAATVLSYVLGSTTDMQLDALGEQMGPSHTRRG